MERKLKNGDRVRLTRDFPDPTRFSPQNLLKGDIGTVAEYRNMLGFYSERIGGLHFTQTLDGKRVNIVDFCELVESSPLNGLTISLEDTGNSRTYIPLYCYNCHKNAIDPETLDCAVCGANYRAEDKDEADLKQQLAEAHSPLEEQEKLLTAKPTRYEIKTLLQDIRDDREADNSLSQLLNDSWEILEISHHIINDLDVDTDRITIEYRRVVTLRRRLTEEKPHATGGFVQSGIPYMVGGDSADKERFVPANPSQKLISQIFPIAEIRLPSPSLEDIANALFGEDEDGSNG